MSYLLFVNSFQVELSENQNFGLTKQANDFANLANRNSNFSTAIKLQRTATNTRILRDTGLLGNTSNFPYQRALANLIDAETGEHVVYNGWVVLEETDATYNIRLYDGNIDFYKSIENINITDVGISGLNHIKNIPNIIESWTTEKPYKYNIADYNGSNFIDSSLNIDYQVPCARVSYLWDQIFAFIGYEYEGSIFGHEKFLDWYLSFPKPTGETVPDYTLLNDQESSDISFVQEVTNNSGNGLFTGSYLRYNIDVFRENFTLPEATLLNANSIPNNQLGRFITILQQGTYRLKFVGNNNQFQLTRRNALGEIVETITQQSEIVFIAEIGDLIYCNAFAGNGNLFGDEITPDPFNLLGLGNLIGSPNLDDLTIEFSKVTGFAVNFEEIFINFKVTDFVKEILIQFGLTPFADKYEKKVKFLTLSELVQGQSIQEFKFIQRLGEKYTFGNYAKSNLLKRKYNIEGFDHNDGSFAVNNENLPDEKTLFQSLIYSPEQQLTIFLGQQMRVYKIWEREIKEDDTIEFKELDGRFYFMRSKLAQNSISMRSSLNPIAVTNGFYYREDYFRLSFKEVIEDFYNLTRNIFNSAKLVTSEFWMDKLDYSKLDLSKLLYVKEESKYFLINKVNAFVPNKPTKLELIELEYFTENTDVPPVDNPTIQIDSHSIVDCTLVLNGSFDGQFLQLIVQPIFGIVVPLNVNPELISQTPTQLVFSLTDIPAGIYDFWLSGFNSVFENFVSNQINAITIDGSCYVEFSEITLSVLNNGFRKINNVPVYLFSLSWSFVTNPTSSYLVEVFDGVNGWFLQSNNFATTDLKTLDLHLAYAPTGFYIRVNGVVSNIVIL